MALRLDRRAVPGRDDGTTAFYAGTIVRQNSILREMPQCDWAKRPWESSGHDDCALLWSKWPARWSRHTHQGGCLERGAVRSLEEQWRRNGPCGSVPKKG